VTTLRARVFQVFKSWIHGPVAIFLPQVQSSVNLVSQEFLLVPILLEISTVWLNLKAPVASNRILPGNKMHSSTVTYDSDSV